MAVFAAHHENFRRGVFSRASKLLRGFGRVDRRGEMKDRDAINIFEAEVSVRSFNICGVLGRGDYGGNVRRHGHGAVIEHGRGAKTFRRRGNTNKKKELLASCRSR